MAKLFTLGTKQALFPDRVLCPWLPAIETSPLRYCGEIPLTILYMWLSFSWSTLSGTGNMHAEENSVTPMCDLDGRPKMNRMTLF